MIPPQLQELLGRYWDLAFQEGKTGANLADEANEILAEISKLDLRPLRPQTKDDDV